MPSDVQQSASALQLSDVQQLASALQQLPSQQPAPAVQQLESAGHAFESLQQLAPLAWEPAAVIVHFSEGWVSAEAYSTPATPSMRVIAIVLIILISVSPVLLRGLWMNQ